jgi:hypothetical protein
MSLESSYFVVSDEVRINYAALYLLKEIVENQLIFSIHLEDDELVLEKIFHWLKDRRFIYINSSAEYVVSTSGFEYVDSFLDRYADFLANYDLFCGVDVKNKDFAIRYLADFQDADAWQKFLKEERWKDLRVAIAEFKGLDAIEIVFMGFVHEERFGRNELGWNIELLLGAIWEEIQLACNNAIRLKSLEKNHGEKVLSSEIVLQDLIDVSENIIKELS